MWLSLNDILLVTSYKSATSDTILLKTLEISYEYVYCCRIIYYNNLKHFLFTYELHINCTKEHEQHIYKLTMYICKNLTPYISCILFIFISVYIILISTVVVFWNVGFPVIRACDTASLFAKQYFEFSETQFPEIQGLRMPVIFWRNSNQWCERHQSRCRFVSYCFIVSYYFNNTVSPLTIPQLWAIHRCRPRSDK